MVLFVITTVIAVLATGVFVLSVQVRDSGDRRFLRICASSLLALSLLLLVVSSVTTVSTKKVGVVTAAGKPTGNLGNGFHLIKPWESVTELDAAIQTDNHTGTDKETPCTTVRIANSSTACVDNSVRWRIRQEAAEELFKDYKDDNSIRDSLVTRELTAALNEAYSSYDPLKAVRDADLSGVSFSHDKVAESVAEKLRTKVGSQIDVLNVIISIVRLDSQTEASIRSYQVAIADTRIAEQKAKTAAKEAEANVALAAGLNNVNVLVANCLRAMERGWLEKGVAPPPGFSCWPNSTNPALIVGK